ncbi:MAG TPA: RDD family protein [Terriglobales bacterium]|nr:RDD family protein [Terriglobales bacterium]
MEGDPRQQDERFAEWYVWAKREVASDNRVCLAAAQAAVEAQEVGADEEAARTAARGSTAGFGVALVGRISPRRRAYAEWYDWARREVGGGRERQHAAARAALDRLDAGQDAAAAAAAGRAAVVTPAGHPPAAGVSPWTPPAAASPWAPPATSSPWAPPAGAGIPPPPQSVPAPAATTVTPWAPAASVSIPGPPPPPAVHVAPAPVHQPHATAPPPAPSRAYAGFGRRTGAWAIDTVLLLIGFFVLYFVGNIFIGIGLLSSGQDPTIENALGAELVLLLIMGVLAWLYYAGLESSAWQGTIGKRLLRLVVTDLYGRRIHFGRATARFFGKIVSALVLGVGYLMVIFTERRQGLHDLMAGTLVVRQEHLALLTAPAPPAAPQQAGGQPGGASEVQGA